MLQPPVEPNSGNTLESLLSTLKPHVAQALADALDGKDISVDQALALFNASGLELNAAVMVADELRRRSVGNLVTYVVNRNINFTNVCIWLNYNITFYRRVDFV